MSFLYIFHVSVIHAFTVYYSWCFIDSCLLFP